MALREPGCDTDLYITEFTYLTDWYGEIPGDFFSRKTASQLLLLNSQSSNTVLWVLREPGCDKDLHHRIFLPKKALSQTEPSGNVTLKTSMPSWIKFDAFTRKIHQEALMSTSWATPVNIQQIVGEPPVQDPRRAPWWRGAGPTCRLARALQISSYAEEYSPFMTTKKGRLPRGLAKLQRLSARQPTNQPTMSVYIYRAKIC